MGEAQVEVGHDMLGCQSEMLELIFGVADNMVLKCAVELRIADIINSHSGPITLSQIASGISPSPQKLSCNGNTGHASVLSPNINSLNRIMRTLVRKKIFTAHHDEASNGGENEVRYGLNSTSRWLLQDSKLTLVPFLNLTMNPMIMTTCKNLSKCVTNGGSAFKNVHGSEVWETMSKNPEFNSVFNDAMASVSKGELGAFLSVYKDELSSIGSLVDVGGGIGAVIGDIVQSCPHIKGINFDLPHVIATAAAYDGVTNVAGNMFAAIPSADAIIMKNVLHDWGDEDCVKILKICKEAIPKNSGRVIILEIALEPNSEGPFDGTRMVFDMMMMLISPHGKERTEIEWKKVLEEGGFPSYKITKIPALVSIIEAFPV